MQSLKDLQVMPLINCLATQDDAELLIIESDLTIAKAMNSTSIQKVGKIIEKRNVVKAITYLTLRLAENFNMKGKFNESQAAILSIDLYEIFGYETLEDVVLMYKLARQGKIGDGKDFKLDGQTVLHKWVPAYLELKAIERENQHQNRKDQSKAVQLPMHKNILSGAGTEKVDYEKSKKQGRHKNAMVVILKRKTDEELREYLLVNDKKSPTFNAAMYELVEKEIDFRNSLKEKNETTATRF